MAKHGMLRDYRFAEVADDIRGSKLYGLDDEKLGKIDDVIFDHFTGQINYVVVDTGGWLHTKKFVVPTNRLRSSVKHDGDFEVSLNKAQIESFPPYDEKDLESDEHWADYEGRYRAKWVADPIMHRLGTDRDITPTTKQMEGSKAGTIKSAGASDPADEGTGAFEQPGFAASTDSVVIDSSAMGIGPRWDRFQDLLRERRKEVIAVPREGDEGLRRAS